MVVLSLSCQFLKLFPSFYNLSLQTSEYVTEEVIHKAFDQFGSVVDVSIKQSAVDQVIVLFLFLRNLVVRCSNNLSMSCLPKFSVRVARVATVSCTSPRTTPA